MAFRKKDKEEKRAGIIVADNPKSVVAEQFRTIRTNIQFSVIDNELDTLSVTSATAESGKTTLSLNLAASFASEGTKVLLVSTDMRKPTLHKVFKVPNTQGMTNLLTNREFTLEDVVQSSYVPNLDYVTSGPVPPNPAELLNSRRMDDLIREMKNQYELVIFDTPPLLAVTDPQIMASKVDGTIVVVPQGEVKKNELEDAAELLEKVNANVLGTVMNKVTADSDSYYYYGEE